MIPRAAPPRPPRRRPGGRRGLPPATGRRARARGHGPAAARAAAHRPRRQRHAADRRPLAAEGRTLAEVAAEARERLAAASLPPMTPGETLPAPIWPAAVSLSLRSYRPVYVGGEVRSAGAFPFAPGLTARRAVVLAGGTAACPTPDCAASSSRHPRPARAQRAAAAARLARLRQELDPGDAGPLPEAERAILAQRREPGRDAPPPTSPPPSATPGRRSPSSPPSSPPRPRAWPPTATTSSTSRTCAKPAPPPRSASPTPAARSSSPPPASSQTATELARTTRELGSVEYEELRRTLDLRLEALTDAAAAAAPRRARRGDRRHPPPARLARRRRRQPADVSVTASDGTTSILAAGRGPPAPPGDLVTVSLAPEPRTN